MPKTPLNNAVQQVFDAYPMHHRENMLALRNLVLEVASSIEGVGEIEETLKWGEPSYLTPASKTGTTIRIDWKSAKPDHYAIYFSCQTDLIDRFRNRFPGEFEFEGSRAMLFSVNKPIPVGPLSNCIAAALTYHRDKQTSRKPKTAG